MRILAILPEGEASRSILEHLGLATEPLPPRAVGPPEPAFADADRQTLPPPKASGFLPSGTPNGVVIFNGSVIIVVWNVLQYAPTLGIVSLNAHG